MDIMRIWSHVRVNSMANGIKDLALAPTGNSLGNCKLTDSDKFVQQSLANRSFSSRMFHIFPFVDLSSFASCCALLRIHSVGVHSEQPATSTSAVPHLLKEGRIRTWSHLSSVRLSRASFCDMFYVHVTFLLLFAYLLFLLGSQPS